MGGIEVLATGYRDLWERAEAVLGGDRRVTDVRPGGSVATGTADEWSDLDVVVCVRDDDYAGFLDDWQGWLAAITPTVFARRVIAPFVVNAVTDAGLTFDVAIYRASSGPWPAPEGYAVGMLSSVRYPDHAAAVEYAVDELFRGLAGPFVSYLGRGEHVRHYAGVAHLLGLLTAVMLAESGAPPAGKRLNPSLTAEQLAALEALPPACASADAIVAFGLAVTREVVRRARPLFERFGLDWPHALEAVARDRVKRHLGIDIGPVL